ncbi:MAG: flagellar hook-length control protein FliK [Phycisphaerae bacterium]
MQTNLTAFSHSGGADRPTHQLRPGGGTASRAEDPLMETEGHSNKAFVAHMDSATRNDPGSTKPHATNLDQGGRARVRSEDDPAFGMFDEPQLAEPTRQETLRANEKSGERYDAVNDRSGSTARGGEPTGGPTVRQELSPHGGHSRGINSTASVADITPVDQRSTNPSSPTDSTNTEAIQRGAQQRHKAGIKMSAPTSTTGLTPTRSNDAAGRPLGHVATEVGRALVDNTSRGQQARVQVETVRVAHANDAGRNHAQKRSRSTSSQQPSPSNDPRMSRAERRSLEAPQFDRIMKAMRLKSGSRHTRARMLLEPPELGRITVNVRMEKSALQVDVATQSSDARELLTERVANLKAALEAQGIQIERFEIYEETHWQQAAEESTEERSSSHSESSPSRGDEVREETIDADDSHSQDENDSEFRDAGGFSEAERVEMNAEPKFIANGEQDESVEARGRVEGNLSGLAAHGKAVQRNGAETHVERGVDVVV